jgi:TraM recognition site of TraD and TraG
MKIPIGIYSNIDSTENVLEIDSFQNTFVDGVSGTGKSTFVEDVIIQDIRAGNPIVFIDPHGPSVRRLLKHIPRAFSQKVIYINPLAKKVIGLNFFHSTNPEDKYKQIANLIAIVKARAGLAWGAETEHVITNAATAVVEQVPNPTIIQVYLFIIREIYRTELVKDSSNQLLKDFSRQFDDELRTSERMSKLSPALNKVAPFIQPIARTIFGQNDALDLIDLIDKGYIILIDLDKGKIGDLNAALIGSAILSYIQGRMFERKAEGRKQATIYVDEFQTFGYGVNWTIYFAEGRKYDVRLWLLTQSVKQIPEEWIDPILNGCNNIFSFAVGSVDAERMRKEFGVSNITEDELLYLSDRTLCAKVKDGLDRNFYRDVALFAPLEPTGKESYWRDVLKTSRMRWGKLRKDVDAAILRELNKSHPKRN